MLWSFILSLSLIFVSNINSKTNRIESEITSLHLPNYLRLVDYTRSLMFDRRAPRGVTADVSSCAQSPIQVNVTLKGGIEAGYFRKLAQHVAMQLCIELCCEEKGCDVAFMSGKNCYGVQCFNGELCKTLPAKKNVTEPVMISHVTFKGERVNHKEVPSSKRQCSANHKQAGVTLHGGLKAGNFTDIGKIDDIKTCIKFCCVAKTCDVALMINRNCFLVACYSRKLCEMVQSLSTEYQPTVAFVARRFVPKKNATSLHLLEAADNQLVCKNSQVFHNTTLKGGYRAGNYTNFGKVENMSACVRLCCGNKDCDVSLMLENNCFAVACKDSEKCLPVHAKTTTSLTALNPRISYITSRSEEVSLNADLVKDGSCHAGIVSYDVSLKGGSNAGNFTPHGKIGSMEACIYRCCQIKGCSVAMMLKDTCFTVICKDEESCEKKQTPTSSDFNPRIAYVFREKNKKPTSKHKPTANIHPTMQRKNLLPSGRSKSLLAERLHAIANVPVTLSSSKLISKTPINTPSSESSNTPPTRNANTSLLFGPSPTTPPLSTPSTRNIVAKNAFNNSTPSQQNISVSTQRTIYNKSNLLNQSNFADHFSININIIENKPEKQNYENTTLSRIANSFPANTSRETLENFKSKLLFLTKLKSTLTSVDGDPSCTSSEVLHNVTLRNGQRSGHFKDRGEMEDIKQCVKLCCLLEKCDLAFMLQKTCFSVECLNRQSCDAVPAKSSIYSPTICYVYVKSAPQVT